MNFWQTLPQPIIGLAPMDGVTDAAFRRIVSTQGPADVSVTEFTSVNDICHGPDFLLSSLLYDEGERPVIAQLYGNNPDLFYRAAHVVCELGFDGLDINMGCPSRNVAASGSGAGLIRTPDLAHAIIRATRQGIEDWSRGQTLTAIGLKSARVDFIGRMNRSRTGGTAVLRRVIPLSVKTRLGYDSVVIERWVDHLLKEHPAVISIHGRTLEQMYRGQADWRAIARATPLVKGTSTLLIGNGDVQSMRGLISRIWESGVHGVLVGRRALGSPWFFRMKEIARTLSRDSDPSDSAVFENTDFEATPHLSERFRVLLTHARLFETLFGVERFPRMRKHLGWYCTGFRHAAALRAAMVRASSSLDVERQLAHRLHEATPSDDGSARRMEAPVASGCPCA